MQCQQSASPDRIECFYPVHSVPNAHLVNTFYQSLLSRGLRFMIRKLFIQEFFIKLHLI